jgi:hypothetical protein
LHHSIRTFIARPLSSANDGAVLPRGFRSFQARAGTRDGIVSVSKKLAQPAALPAIILAAALMLTVGPSAALRIVDRAGDPATAHRLGTVSSEIQMTAFLRRRSASRCRVAFGGVRCEFLPQITRGGVNAR